MSNLRHRLKHELLQLTPVVLFFFIAFQLLALSQSLIMKEYGIRAGTFLAATILALVVAKVVVITDLLPMLNRFPEKPLVYNVVWKTAIYFIASLGVRYAEHLIDFWRKSASFAIANRRMFAEIVWPHFWAVQLWLLILLLVYCAVRELIRALGKERVIQMFFREPAKQTR